MADWYNILDQADMDAHIAAADPHTQYVLSSEIGTAVQAQDSDLQALATVGNGIPARNGTGSWAARTISPATGVTVQFGDGVSGNPTIGLDEQTGWAAGAHSALRTLDNGASLSDTQDYLITLVADLLAGKQPRA